MGIAVQKLMQFCRSNKTTMRSVLNRNCSQYPQPHQLLTLLTYLLTYLPVSLERHRSVHGKIAYLFQFISPN